MKKVRMKGPIYDFKINLSITFKIGRIGYLDLAKIRKMNFMVTPLTKRYFTMSALLRVKKS